MSFIDNLTILYDIIIRTKRNKNVSRGENMSNKVSSGFEILHELIKLTWVPEIIKSIALGNENYTTILKSIPYLSHTELNRKLKILLNKNVIIRQEEGSKIHYRLNSFGEDLVHIFNHLEELEEKYLGA